MRRVPAALLLLLISAFLGMAAWDDCEPGEEDCPPACHLGCVDGCGVVTPPEATVAGSGLVLLEAVSPELPASRSLAAPLPEHSPPRV